VLYGTRRGAAVPELGTGTNFGPLDLEGAYTYANYRFVDFTVDTAHYAGHRIPGIPRQVFQATAAVHSPFGVLVAETNVADRMFVNDANSESSPGFAIANARFLTRAVLGLSSVEVTFGAQNLFDRKYVSSVSVNASGGKFYEPGSRRSVYVGVSLLGATKASR
jgi:iron complex outermembrane receptor protein